MIKDIKEILDDVFDGWAILIILGIFFGSFFTFLIIGDTFLIALKDSFMVTIGMTVMILFGSYVKHFEKKE
jgi:hypothetical protein